MKVKLTPKKSPTFHDFPYSGPQRKCMHMWIINVTPPGAPHCIHKCPFCYARWSIYGDRNWNAPMKVYSNLTELVKREIEGMDLIPPVSISNVTDPAQDVPELRREVEKLLKLLFEKGITVLMCTKGNAEFAVRLACEAGHTRFVLQVSIEGPDEVLRITSPGAPPLEKRLQLIRLASSHRFFTIARIDPFFLHIWKGLYRASWREKAQELIEKIAGAGASHIIASTGRFSGRTLKWKGSAPYSNDFHHYLQICKKLALDPEDVKKDFVREKACGVGGLWLKTEIADEVHSFLLRCASSKGLTYAICQDLSTLQPDGNLPSCYRTPLPFVIRKNGRLTPISSCTGNCLKCNIKNPVCTHLQKRMDPLKKKDLKIALTHKISTFTPAKDNITQGNSGEVSREIIQGNILKEKEVNYRA